MDVANIENTLVAIKVASPKNWVLGWFLYTANRVGHLGLLYSDATYGSRLSRLALWCVLSELRKQDQSKQFLLAKTETGQPFISLGTQAVSEYRACSIAHTDTAGVAVICLDERDGVGIDIETIRQFSDEFIALFTTEAERAYLYNEVSLLGRPAVATRMWAFKEAYLKLLGIGIKKHPRSVDVLPLVSGVRGDFWNGYRYRSLGGENNHVVTLVVCAKNLFR